MLQEEATTSLGQVVYLQGKSTAKYTYKYPLSALDQDMRRWLIFRRTRVLDCLRPVWNQERYGLVSSVLAISNLSQKKWKLNFYRAGHQDPYTKAARYWHYWPSTVARPWYEQPSFGRGMRTPSCSKNKCADTVVTPMHTKRHGKLIRRHAPHWNHLLVLACLRRCLRTLRDGYSMDQWTTAPHGIPWHATASHGRHPSRPRHQCARATAARGGGLDVWTWP